MTISNTTMAFSNSAAQWYMVYREEIRLDKIIDDLQDYVTYTNEHGIPRPPIHPNPHIIPYGLSQIIADISDSSSSDDDDDVTFFNTA
jgi:hypothetical protein